jgi:ribosomal protein S18
MMNIDWVECSDLGEVKKEEKKAKTNNSSYFILKNNPDYDNVYLELNFVYSNQRLNPRAVTNIRNEINRIIKSSEENYEKRTVGVDMVTLGGVSYETGKKVADMLVEYLNNNQNMIDKNEV